jgi:hypothetical protein
VQGSAAVAAPERWAASAKRPCVWRGWRAWQARGSAQVADSPAWQAGARAATVSRVSCHDAVARHRPTNATLGIRPLRPAAPAGKEAHAAAAASSVADSGLRSAAAFAAARLTTGGCTPADQVCSRAGAALDRRSPAADVSGYVDTRGQPLPSPANRGPSSRRPDQASRYESVVPPLRRGNPNAWT